MNTNEQHVERLEAICKAMTAENNRLIAAIGKRYDHVDHLRRQLSDCVAVLRRVANNEGSLIDEIQAARDVLAQYDTATRATNERIVDWSAA